MEELGFSNRKIIIIAAVLVLINCIMSALLTYITVAVTPFLFIVITAMICILTQQLNLVRKSLILAALIIANDIIVKWLTQAYKLPETMEFINQMRMIGLIPAYLIILIDSLIAKNRSKGEKILGIVLFPLIIALYTFIIMMLSKGSVAGASDMIK